MSSGNLNTYGGKKTNFPFQHNLLLINSAISAAVAGAATEATAQLILTALQSGQDYEAKLVRDSSVPPLNFIEVRIFNVTTGTFDPPVYYLAGSTTPTTIGGPGGPVAPIVYIDPTTLLSTIASNTTGLATQVTLAALEAKLNSLGQKASAGSAPVVLSTEQEAILVAIDAVLDNIKTDTGLAATELTLAATNTLLTTIDSVLDNILLDTTTLATPATGLGMTLNRRTDATGSPIAAGKRRISVYNAGGAVGSVLGTPDNILPGETVTWAAGNLRDTLGAFAYDGSGTTLVITTVG